MARITRDQFLELLFAVHRFSLTFQPPADAHERTNQAAVETAHALFNVLDHDRDGVLLGVNIAVRLYDEVASTDDPAAYAAAEIERAIRGEREQDHMAQLVLPAGHSPIGVGEPLLAQAIADLLSSGDDTGCDGLICVGAAEFYALRQLVGVLTGRWLGSVTEQEGDLHV